MHRFGALAAGLGGAGALASRYRSQEDAADQSKRRSTPAAAAAAVVRCEAAPEQRLGLPNLSEGCKFTPKGQNLLDTAKIGGAKSRLSNDRSHVKFEPTKVS